jgi:hypothetical protein
MTVSMPKLEQETSEFQQNCLVLIEYEYESQGLHLFFPTGLCVIFPVWLIFLDYVHWACSG